MISEGGYHMPQANQQCHREPIALKAAGIAIAVEVGGVDAAVAKEARPMQPASISGRHPCWVGVKLG